MGPRMSWIEGISEDLPVYRTQLRCEYRAQYDSELKFTLKLNDIKLIRDIEYWMKENLRGSYIFAIETKDYIPTKRGWVHFSRQEDAMAFKLRWL